ncbi:hypothetical protein HMPREF9073_01526 [Capnocytophaga sp. oral taxon 326 str. F0382]|nr:hypothetical protein HMPREF9073_01526 [Capnocytophaga sp. oral taxon 326 str. F0382]
MVVRRLFGAKVENNQEFSKFEGLEHKKTLPKLQAVRAKTLAKYAIFQVLFPLTSFQYPFFLF